MAQTQRRHGVVPKTYLRSNSGNGKNTWDDPKLPKPLPDRINYVVGSKHVDPQYQPYVRWINTDAVNSIKQIQVENPDKNVVIIGGKMLYDSTLDIVDRIYLTRMKGAWFTDTRINLDLYLAMFRLKSVTPGPNCTFEVWDRVLRFS